MLKELQQALNLTYIFISHDLSVVRHVSDTVAVMYLGRIVEFADKARFFRNAMHPYSRALLSAVPVPDPDIERARQRIILTGDLPSPANPPSGCRFRTRCPYAEEPCAATDPPPAPVVAGHWAKCIRLNDIG